MGLGVVVENHGVGAGTAVGLETLLCKGYEVLADAAATVRGRYGETVEVATPTVPDVDQNAITASASAGSAGR